MLNPNSTLQHGRYRITRPIGQAGMGAVYPKGHYEAYDKELNNRIAIKEALVNDPTLLRAFEREAQRLARLRHIALLRVIDHFTDGKYLPTEVPPTEVPTATQPPPPSATPTLGAGATTIAQTDGMVQVYVPEGDFEMGSGDDDPDADSDEQPRHTVYLDAFWIDQTEMTNAMFTNFVAETEHQTDAEKEGSGCRGLTLRCLRHGRQRLGVGFR